MELSRYIVFVVDMTNIVKLRKSGNSAILTITRDILTELGWDLGDFIEMTIKEEEQKGVRYRIEGKPSPEKIKHLEIRKVKYVPV